MLEPSVSDLPSHIIGHSAKFGDIKHKYNNPWRIGGIGGVKRCLPYPMLRPISFLPRQTTPLDATHRITLSRFPDVASGAQECFCEFGDTPILQSRDRAKLAELYAIRDPPAVSHLHAITGVTRPTRKYNVGIIQKANGAGVGGSAGKKLLRLCT